MKKNTFAPLKMGYQISQEKTDDYEMYVDDDDYIQNPLSSHKNRNETIEYETDQNYLAFSDTDTVECYTVPSPIYPALPDKKDQQHMSLDFYTPAGERVR